MKTGQAGKQSSRGKLQPAILGPVVGFHSDSGRLRTPGEEARSHQESELQLTWVTGKGIYILL